MTKKTTRNDDLSGAQQDLGDGVRRGFKSGWLTPLAAWAFYKQHGVVRHVVNRMAILMTKAGWDYEKADVVFNWADVQSDLETLGLQAAMRSATIWTLIFGAGAIFLDVDDSDWPLDTPLDPAAVRKIRALRPMASIGLRPEKGNYAKAEHFIRIEDQVRIHRSRLMIMVSHDVPTSLGFAGHGFINSRTGWPSSWLEGIYESHCDWASAERSSSQLLRANSLLYAQLKGLRLAATATDAERDDVQKMLDDITDQASNETIMFFDEDDELVEVSRSMTGMHDLVQGKKETFVADTGTPEELVLMKSASSLGSNNGPVDAYNDVADGNRVDMLTPVVTRVTDLDLVVIKRQKALMGEDVEIPKRYTVVWRPVADSTGAEKAKERNDEATARKKDWETGTPWEVIASDPKYAENYPALIPYLESLKAAEEQAKLAEAAGGPKRPEDDLVSASVVAQRLGLGSISTLIAAKNAGEFSGRKLGGRWKFYWSEVEAWLERLEGKGETPADQTEDRVDSGLGLSEHDHFGDVFGASEAMREIFAVLEVVTPSDLSVLITGESGTGKEGIARGLHGERAGDFVAVNCGSLSDASAADVLREVAKAGSAAKAGTLFLDEVGELSASGQAALLRVLGDLDDVRVVSATWRDVHDGWSFRLDLLMRLAGAEVEIPPLRERGGDVLVLAQMFAGDLTFSPDAIAAIEIYHWPGNVRELKNAVERGVLFAGASGMISAEHLQLRTGPR